MLDLPWWPVPWWNRKRELEGRRAEVEDLRSRQQPRSALAAEFDSTVARLNQVQKSFGTRASWDDVELRSHREEVGRLESKLVELRSRGIGEMRPRGGEESRVISGFPWLETNPAIPFGSGGPPHPSQVKEGIDNALRLAPLYAAARILADGIASLPLQVYKPADDGTPQRYRGPSIFNRDPQSGGEGQGPSVTGTLYGR